MSNFCDQTKVTFIAGRGGDGAVIFRHEKYIAFGGPSGGDGGRGGNVILVADSNLNTLADFNSTKIFRAKEGKRGGPSNMTGAEGEELILKVPEGTLIFDATHKKLLCDLKKQGEAFIVAKGGRGGRGNTSFKSSINKAPNFAENGEDGQNITVVMELKLIADIGIIGYPSAGKSTLISVISNAKPKIADYPFTTLIPNLGVVDMRKFEPKMKDSFVVADIPGLIEGAHEGKGLGHQFLRHVERAKTLVHLLDATRFNTDDYKIINKELRKFSKYLSAKEQIVVISKSDTLDEETLKLFIKELEKKQRKLKGKVFKISSVTGAGIKELVFEMYKKVLEQRAESNKNTQEKILKKDEIVILKPHENTSKFEITVKNRPKMFVITGRRIEQVVNMTDIENPEGLERVHHFLNKMGIASELRKLKAKPGDTLMISGKKIYMRS